MSDKKYIDEQKIYYADTDSYGVAWHGSCIKWFEKGRVEFCELCGLGIHELELKGIVFPVVNLNVRYKSPALINDIITIETAVKELGIASITFSHEVKNKATGKTLILATTTVVVVNSDKTLFRKLPDFITNALN